MRKEQAGELLAQHILQTRSCDLTVDDQFIDPYGGHLHHPGVLYYFEAERVSLFAENGLDMLRLQKEQQLKFVLRKANIRYREQVYEGDSVSIQTHVSSPKFTLLTFHQMLLKNTRIAIDATLDVGMIQGESKPIAIPDFILEALAK